MDFKKQISEFYINASHIDKNICSRTIYKQLFKNSVKNVFYWCEEDWIGNILAIMNTWKNLFVYMENSDLV